ncbi:hypothetical protein IQ07DRAFT_562294 [Pyrenochaeta sp. DS3sAY3a]|nr:hypothetical protein IQ07DRAFT_562294 [Pyrenochaeta sp. DS3sAY3a]
MTEDQAAEKRAAARIAAEKRAAEQRAAEDKAFLNAFFKKSLSDSAYQSLRERLSRLASAPRNTLRRYINDFISDGSSDAEASDLLRFLHIVLTYADDNVLAIRWIVGNAEAPNLGAVAAALFPRQNLDDKVKGQTDVDSGLLNNFRALFFNNHALVVMRALVRSDKFTSPAKTSDGWDEKKALDTIITVLIDGNVDLTDPHLSQEVAVILGTGSKQDENINSSIDFVKSLKLLSRVVEDPEYLPRLINRGFRHIRQISSMLKADFVTQVTKSTDTQDIPNTRPIDETTALKIHDAAERADCWNEQLWLSLVQASQKDHIPLHLVTTPGRGIGENSMFKGTPSFENASGRSLDNFTDLFRIEDKACSECESATSLSAYLASLLDFLKDTSFTQGITRSVGSVQKTANNLLELLSLQRPDLVKLEFSCANSQTLVPAISLVNEVLESYIHFIDPTSETDPTDAITAYQTPEGYEDESSHSPNYRPGNINFTTYQESIQKQRFPLTVFPYDISDKIQKAIFALWEVPFSSVVENLQTPNFSAAYLPNDRLSSITPTAAKRIRLGEKEVLERQFAAEVLGLHQIDFAAITGQTFFPLAFADLINGFSDEPQTVQAGFQEAVASLWGYRDITSPEGTLTKKSQMSDKNTGTGLSFIKRQFMPRSGLDFAQVLELVKTQCFGQHLVITTKETGGAFTDSIEDLRLVSNAASPPFQPLTEELAFALQSFIRLRTKLNWSIRDLDAAIFLFHTWPPEEQPTIVNQSPSEILMVTPYIMRAISSVVQLGKLADLDPSSLLPLWGRLDSHGDQSLLFRKFKTTPRTERNGIFALASSAEETTYFTLKGQSGRISDYAEVIADCLQWPTEDFPQLLISAGLDQEDAQLDIDSFSSLYRLTILCKILGIKSKDSERSLKPFLASSSSPVLATPQATFKAVQQWHKVLENERWSPETIADVTGRTRADDEAKSHIIALQMTAAILDGFENLERSAPFKQQGPHPTALDVSSSATLMLHANTAKAVVALVEADTMLDAKAVEASPLLKRIQELMVGIDTPPQPVPITNTVAATQGEINEEEKAAMKREDRIRARRDKFINFAKAEINKGLVETLILNTVQGLFQDFDPSVASLLLSDLLTTGNKESLIPLGQALKDLAQPDSDALSSPRMNAYFRPKVSGVYSIALEVSASNVSLQVDGAEIPFNVDTKTFAPIRLVAGKLFLIQATVPASSMSYSVPDAPPSPFSTKELISSKTIASANLIYGKLKRATTVITGFELTLREVEYMALNKTLVGQNLVMDLNYITLRDLSRLQEYNKLRSRSKVSTENLLSLFGWLRTTTQADLKTILSRASSALHRNGQRHVELVSAKYPDAVSNPLEMFRQFDFFLELQALFDFDERLALGSTKSALPAVKTLLELIRPKPTLAMSDEDVKRTKALQSSISPSQKTNLDGAMAEGQRKALVEYLLQQDSIRKERISDADGLFKKFLIDVNMGPQLRTSRIKQAISVVQLFVQRCLLGMEDGIPKTLINRPSWEWRQHYTLWEAHTNMFLYPENWIDPSLRDDKSPQFEQLESTLMQKNLSVKTFVGAIQTYIYDLNEIASLDIVTYLHETAKSKDAKSKLPDDIFHFFGRTRVSPITFYYRNVTILGGSRDVFWKPWTKIETSLPAVENGFEGARLDNTGSYLLPLLLQGRLYLFMLELNAKTVSNGPPADTMSMTMDSNKKTEFKDIAPKRHWELMLGWTELVQGTWTKKRLAPGSLNVGITELPLVSQLRMEPVFFEDRIEILVCFGKRDTVSTKGSGIIGAFSFTRDQAMIIPQAKQVKPPDFATEFGKANGKLMNIKLQDESKNDTTTPLIWMPSKLSGVVAKENVQWTLSKTSSRVTGLVLNAKESDTASTSYFLLPKQSLDNYLWGTKAVEDEMKLMSIDSVYSQQLMQAAVDPTEPLQQVYGTMSKMRPQALADNFGSVTTASTFHEQGSPSAIYNWELGVHAILLAVDRFLAAQLFDDALQVARLLFDPTTDTLVAPQTYLTSCWKFPPFSVVSDNVIGEGDHPINVAHMENELRLAISERRSYGQLVHAAARSRPQAYMKWIVMKYAEILIESGDVYFRQGTLESLPLATQRYIEASHVLGPEPEKVPKLGKRRTATYDSVNLEATNFDLSLPFQFQLTSLPDAAAKAKGVAVDIDKDPRKENIFGIMKSRYFAVTINPKFKAMRSKVFTRLYNIRNSLDIEGKPVVYALREPPLDINALMSLSNSGLTGSQAIGMIMGSQNSPMPRHRFDFVLQRAIGLCGDLRSLGDRLVASIERKDAEELSQLTARHNMSIQSMMLDIKRTLLTDAEQTLVSLQMNRDTQVAQLGFYLDLIGEPRTRIPGPKDKFEDIVQEVGPITQDDLRMSQQESLEMHYADVASTLNKVIVDFDVLTTAFAALPTISGNIAPFGVGMSISAGGSNISAGFQAVGVAMKGDSAWISDQGARAGRKAGMIRQLQERRLQANMRGREIKSIDKQIEIQQIRVNAAKKEIDVQLRESENAQRMEGWYRTKYSNRELYAYMEKSLRSLYFQAYTLAVSSGLQAQAALSFELGKSIPILQTTGYWDASRDGLFAADHLFLDLKRLEEVHLDTKKSDFEITKTVSLRQINPTALMELRLTGKTNFSVSEFQYDMDFPGHYMRRIRSVAVTIPAVLSPYSNINATLTLMDHSYRITADARTADDYKPNPNSFRKDGIPISSIAVSSGAHDAGVFELNFAGSQYTPFEGAGAISSWRLELPQEIQKFDYTTISDVMLHIQYTALDGGAVFASAANASVRQISKGIESKGATEGYYGFFDLRNDFSAWHMFSSKLLAAKGKDEKIQLDLGNVKDRLPFFSRRAKTLTVQSISLVSKQPLLLRTCNIKTIANFSGDTNDALGERPLGSHVMRTRNKVNKELTGDWVVEASSSAVGKDDKEIGTIFLLIQYVFG